MRIWTEYNTKAEQRHSTFDLNIKTINICIMASHLQM